MQLNPSKHGVVLTMAVAALSAATATFGAGQMARAGVTAESRVTFFREPSTANAGVTVIHPQTDVTGTLGKAATLNAGYDVDVVSGATPSVFSAKPIDAVSGATQFSDLRQTARVSAGWNLAAVGLTAGYSYGWENDYLSHTAQVAAHSDFLQRNFTLDLAYTHNFDSVCDRNNAAAQGPMDRKALTSSDRCFESGQSETVTRKLNIDTFEPSLSWTASPRLLLQGGVTLQILRGFQASPYRRVLIGSQGRTPQESLPEHRERYAVFGRVNYAIPALRAAILLGARGYRDTWDVMAVSGDLMFRKYLSDSLILQLRGRWHEQLGAIFYRSGADYQRLGPVGAFWTGDRELAPMRVTTAGVKFAHIRQRQQDVNAFFDEIELSLKFDGMRYQVQAGGPNNDRKFAFVGQVAAALRF